jgi:hypothetical protein
MLSDYQQQLRDRFLEAPVLQAPQPWQPVVDHRVPIGGLLGIGFASHPDNGRDLVMVVSHDGHGLFDATTGNKIARDLDPDPDTSTPDASPDLTCPASALSPAPSAHRRPVRRRPPSHDAGRLEPGRCRPGLAPPPRPALSRRQHPQRPTRPGLVAHLPLRLLHPPHHRILTYRPNPRHRHQQRHHSLDKTDRTPAAMTPPGLQPPTNLGTAIYSWESHAPRSTSTSAAIYRSQPPSKAHSHTGECARLSGGLLDGIRHERLTTLTVSNSCHQPVRRASLPCPH